MARPRCLRLAWRASTSAYRCSARLAEKARQETPEPFCLGLSTRFTSRCLLFSGEGSSVLSALPLRELTASSSLSESLS